MACHGRDLIDSIVNRLFGTDLAVPPAAVVFPLLTTVGALIGGLPRRRRASSAAGCSVRLALRTSAGDALGLIGFGAMVVGVVVATRLLRTRALR